MPYADAKYPPVAAISHNRITAKEANAIREAVWSFECAGQEARGRGSKAGAKCYGELAAVLRGFLARAELLPQPD